MGLKSNKVEIEYYILGDLPDGAPEDWLKRPWNLHHWTDMFVESCRWAPYVMGHWWAVYFPVSLGTIIYLIATRG